MIVTRFALPVRSPIPLIVPWTWRCAGLDRDERVGDRAAAVVVGVDAERQRRERRADRGDRGGDLARERAAVRVAEDDALGSGVGGGAHAVQRVAGVGEPAVEEVLGVEQGALALPHEERDRLRDHREVLLTLDAHDLLDVQDAGLADERDDRGEALREDPQALVGAGRDAAPARHPETDDLAAGQRLPREQLEQLLLLGVRRGEARLDQMHAEVVEPAHDADLLLRGEAHAAAAHPVAQGGVVQLDGGGHGAAAEPTGTGSSHSR